MYNSLIGSKLILRLNSFSQPNEPLVITVNWIGDDCEYVIGGLGIKLVCVFSVSWLFDNGKG